MPRRHGVHTTALPTHARQLPDNVPRSHGPRGSYDTPGNTTETMPDTPRPGPRGRAHIRRNARITTYNYTTKTISEVVAPDDPNRAYLAMQNRGANAIFLSFGTKAGTESFRLVAGGFYEPYIAPSTSLHILGTVAGENIVIVEGTDLGY